MYNPINYLNIETVITLPEKIVQLVVSLGSFLKLESSFLFSSDNSVQSDKINISAENIHWRHFIIT